MAKSKRKLRAKNKIEANYERALITVDAERFPQAPAQIDRSHSVIVSRSTLFTSEFEAVIEIIAMDRVYRVMRERLERRLRIAPAHARARGE